MSTRSCIARIAGEGKFLGVYHHWDGYPSALGATLCELYNGYFHKDLPTMLKQIIDAHPAGYSTINGADFNLPAGYGRSEPPHGPVCFCHGERSEEAQPITQDDDAGMEWAYVFDEEKRVMHILERVYKDNTPHSGKHMVGMFGSGAPGKQRWADAGTVNLDGPAPDWDKVSADSPVLAE
jgi:hypothetical protein